MPENEDSASAQYAAAVGVEQGHVDVPNKSTKGDPVDPDNQLASHSDYDKSAEDAAEAEADVDESGDPDAPTGDFSESVKDDEPEKPAAKKTTSKKS